MRRAMARFGGRQGATRTVRTGRGPMLAMPRGGNIGTAGGSGH